MRNETSYDSTAPYRAAPRKRNAPAEYVRKMIHVRWVWCPLYGPAITNYTEVSYENSRLVLHVGKLPNVIAAALGSKLSLNCHSTSVVSGY